MRRFMILTLMTLLLAPIALTFLHIQPPALARSSVTLELRLAEEEPGEGLTAISSETGRTLYLHPRVELSNTDIEAMEIVRDTHDGQPVLAVTFTAAGAERLTALSRKHSGKPPGCNDR